jgi:hypothetical protein
MIEMVKKTLEKADMNEFQASFCSKLELYSLLNAGIKQVEQHKTQPKKEALAAIRSKLNN